jgi:hypothetical protein
MTAGPTPSQPPMTRRDLEARIIANAWRDSEYKAALLKHPKKVLQSELSAIDPSVVLPAGLKVHVHEEAPNRYHLVLPRNPKDITLYEVIGDNLETVAPQTVAVVVVGAVAVAVTAAAIANAAANVTATANAVVNANAVGTVNAVA